MSPQKTLDCLVIGAGAAGCFGALRLSELHPGARILVLEAGSQALRKLKISGGGRCNLTHELNEILPLSQSYPRGRREIRSALSRFLPQDMRSWLRSKSVETKVEIDGRVFPVSNRSQSIIDLFLGELQSRQIEIRYKTKIQELQISELVQATLESGESLHARSLLLATGSQASGHQIAKQLGHRIIEPTPSLFSFNIQSPLIEGLSGLSLSRVQTQLHLKTKFRTTGPLLITHWGLSGPSILRLSALAAIELREAGYQAELLVDWKADSSREDLLQDCLRHKSTQARHLLRNVNLLGEAQRLWERMLEDLQIQSLRWSEVSHSQIHQLIEKIKASRFSIKGKTTNKEEFVTAGGVDLKEVDFKAMQSRLQPALFFAGEVLNIDGITGGFNFQSCWSTAEVAAHGISHRLLDLTLGSTQRNPR